MICGHADEGVGRGVPQRRAIDVDDGLQREGEQVGGGNPADGQEEDAGPVEQESHQSRDRDPDEPERADPRQPDEEPVEPADPMQDDDALQLSIEGNQTGTICFAWSTSCCGSNGLPTKPCAPRAVACAAV